MTLPSFAVVIPMYNEKAGAGDCVRKVCAELARMGQRTSLIVVNDGSSDGTGELLAGFQRDEPALIVVTHPANRGYGAALCTGVRRAVEEGFDYVLFMDSDLTNNPADISKFTAKMESGVDVIKASRFTKGGGMRGIPWRRSIFSIVGNLFASALFQVGIRDCTNGFRAVKVGLLARMNLKESGFPIILEELYQATWLARSFCEVPVVLTARAGHQRATAFAYKPEILRKYLSFALKAFFRVEPELQRRTI
jgi:dolichol-phosphate mannosyltransferase